MLDVPLAGYGVAQAMPGPLFTFAAYLGAVMGPAPNNITGAVIALVAIFLPGLLLVYGMLPFWDTLRSRQPAQAAMRGANAAVVGTLGAALYHPVWTSAVLTRRDFALALAGALASCVFIAASIRRAPKRFRATSWRGAQHDPGQSETGGATAIRRGKCSTVS
jgi:chromate transporter